MQENDLEKRYEDERGVVDQGGEGGLRLADAEHLKAHHTRIGQAEDHTVAEHLSGTSFELFHEQYDQYQKSEDETNGEDVERLHRIHRQLRDHKRRTARNDHRRHQDLGLTHAQFPVHGFTPLFRNLLL